MSGVTSCLRFAACNVLPRLFLTLKDLINFKCGEMRGNLKKKKKKIDLFPVRSIGSPFGIRLVSHSSAAGKVRLHASVKVHVMHDHPLLRAEWCAPPPPPALPVFSQHVTSHLCVCARACVSQLCNTHVGLRVRTQRDPVSGDSILYVHVGAPAHVKSRSPSVSVITPLRHSGPLF